MSINNKPSPLGKTFARIFGGNPSQTTSEPKSDDANSILFDDASDHSSDDTNYFLDCSIGDDHSFDVNQDPFKNVGKPANEKLNSNHSHYDPMEYSEHLFPTDENANSVKTTYQGDWRDDIGDTEAGEWVYEQHRDEMRERLVDVAIKPSLNSVYFEKPYREEGGSVLSIELRQPSDRPPLVALTITKGMITSDGNHDKILNVRFDGGPMESYEWHRYKGGLHGPAVIYKDADKFIEKLKAARYIMIGLCFYAGRDYDSLVFKFDVSGLVWDHSPKTVDAAPVYDIDLDEPVSLEDPIELEEPIELEDPIEFEEPIVFEEPVFDDEVIVVSEDDTTTSDTAVELIDPEIGDFEDLADIKALINDNYLGDFEALAGVKKPTA